MQLMELDVPMVLALNMMDEVRENGGSVLVNQMEERLAFRLSRFPLHKTRESMNWLPMLSMWPIDQEKPGQKGLL